MNKQTITGVIIGVVLGSLATLGVSASLDKNELASNTQTTPAADHNTGPVTKLGGLKGDDFDKSFMEEMIKHHQDAIDMAKLIDANARHDELKQLGQDIILAQSKEIDMMQEWQTGWGYKDTP